MVGETNKWSRELQQQGRLLYHNYDMPIHVVPKDAPMKEETYDIHGKPYTLAQAQEDLNR